MLSILYIILALLGVGFLIFIHELGHYLMARKVGITVEVFAIGFGKPIFQWEHKGVKWKLGILPFGGYVKMAGMEKQGAIEPYQVPEGFFGKSPWDRIKVAGMGPLVNIVFAFLCFTFLWMTGGRLKPFTEYTQHIGWVDPDSGLYKAGVRPGDVITKLNGREFHGFNDFLYGAVLDNRPLSIAGQEKAYLEKKETPSFTYEFPFSSSLKGMEKASLALSSLSAASYLIYDKMPNGSPNVLLPGSPLEASGIEYGDRILWVDGQLIFSKKQLIQTINASKVLLTVEREGKTFLSTIPRVKIANLRIPASEKQELDDFRYEAKLQTKAAELFFIPYNITPQGVVENPIGYINEESKDKKGFKQPPRSRSEVPLQKGDKIIAVQGKPISSAYELLKELQTFKSLIIVSKKQAQPLPIWKDADKAFDHSFDQAALEKMVNSIGTGTSISKEGSLMLLHPITPLTMQDFPLNQVQQEANQQKLGKYKKAIEDIEDVQKKEEATKWFERYQNRLILGVVLQDQLVKFNPTPLQLFGNVLKETYRTFYALITGYLSPKNVMGPVGIVQVIHYGWSVGAKEALFWLGMISLNLGILNLLPLPILDGGYIALACVEKITKKPLKAKTMQRLIVPFLVLFVGFFVYLTYHDLARLVGRFF